MNVRNVAALQAILMEWRPLSGGTGPASLAEFLDARGVVLELDRANVDSLTERTDHGH